MPLLNISQWFFPYSILFCLFCYSGYDTKFIPWAILIGIAISRQSTSLEYWRISLEVTDFSDVENKEEPAVARIIRWGKVVQGSKPQWRKRREIATWESFQGDWESGGSARERVRALTFSHCAISDTEVEMSIFPIPVVPNTGEDSVPVYMHPQWISSHRGSNWQNILFSYAIYETWSSI